jgi:hypothetical protein
MARGTRLIDLLKMLKAEMGNEPDSAVAPGGDGLFKAVLSNQQNWLSTQMDWPFMIIRAEMAMVPGQRYYNFPEVQGYEFDKGAEIYAECEWATYWNPVRMGITHTDYNALNPELNVRIDPVRGWQLYNSGDNATTQFEVWPLPATATKLRLTGQRELAPLVGDLDRADLDDLLIVLFTAAELLTRFGDSSASAKLDKAKALMARLRSGIVTPNETFNVGGGRNEIRRDWENRPTVAVMVQQNN